MAEPSNDHAVQARGLRKQYGEVVAVDSIDFEVERGETFGFLGPNGAGKSTTMRMIYCRTPLTSGSLLVEGLDVTRYPNRIKKTVGVVPQENNLDPDLHVMDNLLVYARYFRIPAEEARRRAEQLLHFVALGEKRDVGVEELSGGMKRRLILARALINEPTVLILDEPTTGLDPHVRHTIWEKLRELRQRNTTVVLSTHYMEEAEKICDRLIIMDKGRILTGGKPKDLIAEFVQKFVLEVHKVDGSALVTGLPEVVGEVHGVSHYYFAPSPDLLSPIMARYDNHESLLRPSNLEDVFLRLTGRERLE